jgi:hypothetical protein
MGNGWLRVKAVLQQEAPEPRLRASVPALNGRHDDPN